MESSKIKELAQDQQDYVVAMRREFHRSPELSGKEFHTRERLIEEIEKMADASGSRRTVARKNGCSL